MARTGERVRVLVSTWDGCLGHGCGLEAQIRGLGQRSRALDLRAVRPGESNATSTGLVDALSLSMCNVAVVLAVSCLTVDTLPAGRAAATLLHARAHAVTRASLVARAHILGAVVPNESVHARADAGRMIARAATCARAITRALLLGAVNARVTILPLESHLVRAIGRRVAGAGAVDAASLV